jgi:hypothetical protein
MRTIKTVKICQDKHVTLEPEREGDFLYTSNILLVRQDTPSENDVIKAAEGKWVYRPIRFSLEIDKSPVYGRLDIHTHYRLKGIRREYLGTMLPQDLPPRIMPHDFDLEGSFKLTLHSYYHQLLLLTMPGDRTFIRLYRKEPFRGKLEVLFC